MEEWSPSVNSDLKDKNTHRSHAVYKGDCSFGDSYIGKTMRNVQVPFDEHINSRSDSEPALHLLLNPSHSFSWCILCMAQSTTKRRILQGLLIQQWKPYEDIIGHCSYTPNLSSCEIKALKKVQAWTGFMGSNPSQARTFFRALISQVVCITTMINHVFISF